MLSGDFSTMALPDFLQWADASRVAGTLLIERDAETSWMQLAAREVLAASKPPNQPVALDGEAGFDGGAPAVAPSTLALEHLYDQFLDPTGGFRFLPGEDRSKEGVSVQIGVGELLMESMRLLDEWPRLQETFGSDSLRPRVTLPAEAQELTEIQAAVLACCERGLTLADTQFSLGLSRPALLRRVDELRVLGRVTVEGTSSGGDLAHRLIAQATKLLKAKQFDEATHVFAALLTSDPTASTVRALLKEAEREHVQWLYEELPPHLVPHAARASTDFRTLTNVDRDVLDRINGRWDVSVLVLASPYREAETLKALRRLVRVRAIELRET